MSLNWLNSKMVSLFVGLFVACAILYVGSQLSPIHGIYDIFKPLATRFGWALSGLRGKATYGGAVLGLLVQPAASLRYLCSAR